MDEIESLIGTEEYEREREYTLAEYTKSRMLDRLEYLRESEGKYGWYNEKLCTIESLRIGLAKAIEGERLIDIINYAAMINAREHLL